MVPIIITLLQGEFVLTTIVFFVSVFFVFFIHVDVRIPRAYQHVDNNRSNFFKLALKFLTFF